MRIVTCHVAPAVPIAGMPIDTRLVNAGLHVLAQQVAAEVVLEVAP